MRPIASSAVLIAVAAIAAPAQMVVSAHSGTIHYFEGDVSLDGIALKAQPGHFDQMKEKSVLRTTRGRAEILLTPGVFLRVGESSAVQLLDNRLASTRVEILSGTATVETDTSLPASGKSRYETAPVTIVFKDYDVQPVKDGLFEIFSSPGRVRVFKGEASVHAGDNRVTVKDGHEVFLSAALAMDKFDEKTAADDNYLWARDRSAEVSAANMSSARTIANSGGYGYGSGLGYGLGYSGLGGFGGYSPYWASGLWGASMYGGGWYFNPLFDMYTYMPLSGYGFSPFGYGFYSPAIINSVYTPSARTWYGGGGSRTGVVIGRPVSGGPREVARGSAISSSAFRATTSANVISNRMASSVAARTGGISRGTSSGFSGGGMGARSAGPAVASASSSGGFARGGGGGGPRGR